ncbi:hypothetical protein T10_11921, partial [Trichinella papuae]
MKQQSIRYRPLRLWITNHSTNISNNMIVSEIKERLSEEEKIRLMLKESTGAHDLYAKLPQRKRKSAWSYYCKCFRQEELCTQLPA